MKMKKTLLGITWQVIGFLGAILILCTAGPQNWTYNGITGLAGALLGTHLMFPLVVCVLFFLAGIALCVWDMIGKNDR